MKNRLKGNIILFFTAIIWGISFVSQSVGMEYIDPNTFMGIRTTMGGLVLLPFIFFTDRRKKKQGTYQKTNFKKLLVCGAICGVFLCIASTLQTYGLKYTTTAKSGFLTALYIIFVAILGLFYGKKLNFKMVIGVLTAVLGMYFLCLFGNNVTFNVGDFLTIICAIFFAGQILFIDKFVHEVDGIKLSCTQFLISGGINLILMFLIEQPNMTAILSCTTALLYSGIMSCGVAYTLQVVGQQYAEPTSASIIMSFESVFAAISGWIILSEAMNLSQIFGCLLMFLAIVLVQLPDKKMVLDCVKEA
ncbi:MAG: DMT family transporter [Clostridia bacterium]|nr:DMT family transporter [Clostridia bacterium]